MTKTKAVENLKPSVICFSLKGTILVINGKPFILKEGKREPESIDLNEENLTIYKLIEGDKGSVWIKNENERLDMKWILKEHRRNIIRWRAIMAICDATDNGLEDSLRMSGINWLEWNLNDTAVEYFIRNTLTATMLGEIKDLEGAIKLAREVEKLKTLEILENRIKKIVPREG